VKTMGWKMPSMKTELNQRKYDRTRNLTKKQCEVEIKKWAEKSVKKCYKDNKKLIDALGNKKEGSE